MKKLIPLNKITMEHIDPFLPKNQIVDVTLFEPENISVTLYYHYKKDSMMVRVEKDSKLVWEEQGARPTYNQIVTEVEYLINEN